MGIVSVSDIHDGMGRCKENLGDQMIRVHRWFRFNPLSEFRHPSSQSGVRAFRYGLDAECRSVRSSEAQ
jgi:hypothetical protein